VRKGVGWLLRRLETPSRDRWPNSAQLAAWSCWTASNETRSGVIQDTDQEWLVQFSQDRERVLAIGHPDWRGVRSSLTNLFEQHLFVRDDLDLPRAEALARVILAGQPEQVVFNGLPLTHALLIDQLHRLKPSLRLSAIWHGSLMQLGEDVDWQGLNHLVTLGQDHVLAALGFVKQGMAEVFRRRGLHASFLQNYVRGRAETESMPMTGGPHLGLWAVEPIWRKIPYTMIAAAGLVEDAHVWARGAHLRAQQVATLVGVPWHGEARPAAQTEMAAQLARMHVNLYVTLSECGPMLPLESLSAGVPCLLGPSAPYFDDYPDLHRRLVVAKADDPVSIAAQIETALAERSSIIDLYRKFGPEHEVRARELLRQFLWP
jgi:glycosyltransferase involved in cell wall biosynthesis